MIADPVASPAVTTAYTLTVTNDAGCQQSGQVTVTVLSDPHVVNTFTPNGDGVNDFWNIPALKDYPNCSVDIYNRSGQLVFHSLGYNKPWNGTLAGSKLPSGTYYYSIDLKNDKKPLAGWVSILR